MAPLLTLCIMLPVLALLCWTDCKYRRLPNAYTLGLAALGIVWRFLFGGLDGLVDGLLGGLVCGLFLLIPFLMKGAGGGDLKMIAAAGIFTGLRYCWAEMLFVSLTGLFLGLGMLVFGRVRSSRLKHWIRTLFDWRYDRRRGAESLPEKSDEKERVPFGVAIALGTVLALAYAYYVEAPA
jgi:prepilin peptidase CpaA